MEMNKMPTYEYECRQCGHHFEQFQSITAPVLKKCPVCAKNRLKRLIGTGAALLFKGSGFYQTDYRSNSYESAAKADKSTRESAASAATKSKSDTSGSSGSTTES